MNKFIKKVLSVSFVFCVIMVMGVFVAVAESNNSTGIHTPEIEINVYSPITDSIGYEISVDVQSLSVFSAYDTERIQSFDTTQVCKNTFEMHQKQIDAILDLMSEHGINNFQDLSEFLQTLQNNGNYLSVATSFCPGNNCVWIPVLVRINGEWLPGFACNACQSIVLL